jgi:hypothetical protein
VGSLVAGIFSILPVIAPDFADSFSRHFITRSLMKLIALTAVASAGALIAVTGCQNSGHARAEASVERPVMTAQTTTNRQTLVATRDTEWVSSPVDPLQRGRLQPGDRVYVDIEPRTASYQEGSYTETAPGGVNNTTGHRSIERTTQMDEGIWYPAKLPDGKTIFIHRGDFRPE